MADQPYRSVSMPVYFEEEEGKITLLEIGSQQYLFRRETEYAGPVFHIVYAGKEYIASSMQKEPSGERMASFWGVKLILKITPEADGIRISAKIKNESSQNFHFERLSLMLGLDTCMDQYPEWNSKPFPTLLRCEKTHFWGYFRSPDQKILGIASPDPIASWSLEYNQLFPDSGHLIKTVRLDLLSEKQQPDRHPKQADLQSKQEMNWEISLFDVCSVEEALVKSASICRAPIFYAKKLLLQPNEAFETLVFSEQKPEVSAGMIECAGKEIWKVTVPAANRTGLMSLTACAAGRISELIYSYLHPWSFYMEAARNHVLGLQKTGTHCESWYGFFSAFLAARFMPQNALDQAVQKEFEQLLSLAFDVSEQKPIILPERIQNSAIFISLCEDLWQITHDLYWLQTGADFADYLIKNHQQADGSFVTNGTHYTCVIYIAKSILELVLAERRIKDPIWQRKANEHFAACKAAIEDLVEKGDHIGTEGEQTFEDGMISCAVAQIAMFALLIPPSERKPYIDAAEEMLNKHRCLERIGSVDARCRNTTIRFWEAQYDVLIPANMITSPHGWSAWKIYGVWYLYLLTGKVEYLVDTMETLGSCMNLVDEKKVLHWAFAVDPCIDSGLWKPDGDGNGHLERSIFGETYIDLISTWYKAPENQPVWAYLGSWINTLSDKGGCCDNDVHECFKALAEVALPYSYIYETNGEIHAVNALLEQVGERIRIIPNEAIVHAVHINLQKPKEITIVFSDCIREYRASEGWLYSDGHQCCGLPEE